MLPVFINRCGAERHVELIPSTGWSEPVPGRELHPLESSAFHGALFRQQSGNTVLLAGMIAPEVARIISRHRWPMDEKQNTDLARSLDQIISLLRGILIALSAILGLLWFRH